MKYIAVYFRYHSKYEEEFDTAKDAAQFLLNGEWDGSLSWYKVEDSSGKELASTDNPEDNPYAGLYRLGAEK